MKTTIQIGFMGGYPQTITVDHPFPLSQDFLDRNGAVVLDANKEVGK